MDVSVGNGGQSLSPTVSFRIILGTVLGSRGGATLSFVLLLLFFALLSLFLFLLFSDFLFFMIFSVLLLFSFACAGWGGWCDGESELGSVVGVLMLMDGVKKGWVYPS